MMRPMRPCMRPRFTACFAGFPAILGGWADSFVNFLACARGRESYGNQRPCAQCAHARKAGLSRGSGVPQPSLRLSRPLSGTSKTLCPCRSLRRRKGSAAVFWFARGRRFLTDETAF